MQSAKRTAEFKNAMYLDNSVVRFTDSISTSSTFPSDKGSVSKLGVSVPKARNVIAQGNALGLGGPMKFWSAESAKSEIVDKTEVIMHVSTHYALSALGIFQRLLPGPMAQAITFRAFGAERLQF